MELALAVDFGSTFTKLTLMDLDAERVVAASTAPNTVDTDVMEGFHLAFDSLCTRAKLNPHVIKHKIACSSAAGGLRMIAIGLVPRLTVQCAKIAALGAGAKVVRTFAYELTEEDARDINTLSPDIILLSGGTDGGDTKAISHNGDLLAELGPNVPYVIAGNRVVSTRIKKRFESKNKFAIPTSNVMPEVNQLNIEEASRAIREIFIKHIVRAKGIDKAQELTGRVVMPTPLAVFNAARILALGAEHEAGIGDLIVIDVGGATTDVDSMCEGAPQSSGVILRGLPRPYAERTVEGDIGLRWSAPHLLEEIENQHLMESLLGRNPGLGDVDLEQTVQEFHHDVKKLPSNGEERLVDKALAYAAVRISTKRHAGRWEEDLTPDGKVYIQTGKDLRNVIHCFGTGGPLIYSDDPAEILQGCVYDSSDPFSLRPKEPVFYIDQLYILYAIGLLTELYPSRALRIAKHYFGVN